MLSVATYVGILILLICICEYDLFEIYFGHKEQSIFSLFDPLKMCLVIRNNLNCIRVF
ncbi:hypothetical protein HanRHA438_Chr04g0180141 [Helianthus annuus]|nr:hypothetical protein HanRHA438_Chr04g0180141 [Helianthus annuus]